MREFDAAVGRFDTPLVVVTTTAGDQRGGCLVGFHSQCSIDPPRYAVWLSKANYTYRVALFATHVAVHGVAPDDRDVARLFGTDSGDETDKFAQCEWTEGPGGVPLLDACPHRFVLERVSLWDDGGDHVCFVGTPVDAHAVDGFEPMRLATGRALEAGHDAHDRAAPAELTQDRRR